GGSEAVDFESRRSPPGIVDPDGCAPRRRSQQTRAGYSLNISSTAVGRSRAARCHRPCLEALVERRLLTVGSFLDLFDPVGVATDAAGNMYFSHASSSLFSASADRVDVYSPTGGHDPVQSYDFPTGGLVRAPGALLTLESWAGAGRMGLQTDDLL